MTSVVDEVETFVRPLYRYKDAMHGLSHVM